MKRKIHQIILIILVMTWNNSGAQQLQGEPADPFTRERKQMVEQQIIRRGINDPEVLRAMLEVPRHLFVDEEDQNEAYEDHPVGIGEGQTISQPYIVAFMTEVLEPDSTMRVLEVGTGSGYQAAILSRICDSVFSIEVFESLGQKASKVLTSLGYTNVAVKIGDGYEGWEDKSPFDAIIVTCAPTHIPSPLKEQLKEGGRMIIPVGEFYNQELILIEKNNGELIRQKVLPVRFVPMIDEKGKKY